VQPRTIDVNGKQITYTFLKWSDGNNDNPRTFFTSHDVSVTAIMKGQGISDNQNAYSNSSQRKFVRTDDGALHSVYESLGRVWYEVSTNNGSTWNIMNGGKPLDSGEGKQPSIDYSYYNHNNSPVRQILIFYQEKFGSGSKVRLKYFHRWDDQVTYHYQNHVDVATVSGDYSTTNTTPVVAFDHLNKIQVAWKNGSNSGLYSKYGYIYFINNNIHNAAISLTIGPTSLTGSNAFNPTIYSLKSGEAKSMFAWEEQSGSNSSIKYALLDHTQISGDPFTVSADNGYTKNFAPSIAGWDNNVRVTWVAYRSSYADGPLGEDDPEGDGPGDPVYLGGETKVFFRSKTNSVWSAFNSYGSNANTVSINRNSNNTFAFAWSEGSSNVNKFVRSDHLSDVFTTNTTGRHLQVGNYSNLNNMRLNSFKTSTSPYSFSLSNAFLVTAHNVTSERQGIIVRDSTVFYFSIGDILINGELAYFVDLPEELNVEDKETLNSYLISEPFNLTDYSTFYYGVQYGVNDSALAAEALSGGGFVNYKVELVDDQTGEILGTFDDVTFDSENILTYTNLAYEVNTQGIGNRTCRLRLTVDDDLDFNYALVTGYDNEGSIGKRGFVQRTLNNIEVIETYDLAQNYPNPFNPSTIIKYQIPEDGVVTLKIFDILGKEVTTLVNEQKTVGKYELHFDASNLASGVYIYRIQVNDFVSAKKMMLLK
jgi:hypothetical protein